MPELLVELLSEEIPASLQARAAEDLKRIVLHRLAEHGLGHDSAQAFATPRRLALVVRGVPASQPDRKVPFKGPRVGAPDKAIQGFLKARGIASIDLCRRETDGKGEFYVYDDLAGGMPTPQIILTLLESELADFPWPKSMRWGEQSAAWVRPLRRIVCLFDGQVVRVTFAGVTAGDATVGHRFLAPEDVTVTGFDDYVAKLRAMKVMLDPAERRRVIAEGARAAARREGLVLVEDDALVAENAGLVEWPETHVGSFDEAYLDVPTEVLISAMREHQRYFSLRDPATGRLASRFVFIANMVARDGGAAIVAGNQRVLRARLADGRFFWDHDRRRTLESRVADLDAVVFHARLGSLGDKARRLERLAAELVQHVPGANAVEARRAALLAKADLTTGMVGEFPDLQGVMGRYYAHHDGETDAVAQAIGEHYAPAGPDDACPVAPVAVVVALADKLDTLAGFFAIDEKPTGSKDPFALRRAALGVIRLVLDNGLRLPLGDVLGSALGLQGQPPPPDAHEATVGAVLDFFADRLKVHLRASGVRHDAIGAVFAKGDDDLVRVVARARALQGFLDDAAGADLLTAYRRAGNIVRIEAKRDGRAYDGRPDPARFALPEERALDAGLAGVAAAADAALAREAFADAMHAMAALKAPVDAFFDRVTVNADDPMLRENRLRLLARIQGTLDRVADFSRIEG
ncbi:MAG: glycine--tRNA ligase subunit beta [Alphaproteobacteria bacterium]